MDFPETRSALRAVLLFLLLTRMNAVFNYEVYEVEKRVNERLENYLGDAVAANLLTATYRENGGFQNDLRAQDRDAYLIFGYSLPQALVYFGLEDGTCIGYGTDSGYYREPGESGYDVNDEEMEKYYKSCVNQDTGEPQNCTMQPGASYIQCVDDCALEKCPDAESQKDCSTLTEEEKSSCENKQKWCKKYTIEEATENMGFLPLTYYCHDKHGLFTQELGAVVLDSSGNSGNCYFRDGITLVNRSLAGDYAYCNGDVCENTFAAGFRSDDYDPRYRPWYTQTKELQIPNWSPPFPFYDNLDIGITYSHPIYSEMGGKNVFAGVLAIDYTLGGIADFLVDSYGDTATSMVIYEDAEPNYLIGTSTGSDAAKKVLASDETQPCPENVGLEECKAVRVEMSKLSGHEMDTILVRAFEAQQEAGYLQELISVKASDNVDSNLYTAKSTLYERSGAKLKWRVIVVSPAEESTSDSITLGNTLFGPLCVIGGLGVVICLGLFVVFYWKRTERAVIFADWRFTCAFILGCTIMNGSTFTLLGPNTDATCMLRMWSFHFCFVLALSPLFAKIWRMKKLVGETSFRRIAISHGQTACYTLPMIATQIVILTIFSIVDPPKQTEIIENDEGVLLQQIICAQDTNAFFIVALIYEGTLVLLGCVLSYMTRNLDARFGESRQLIFAMYNIAFIAIIIIILISLMGIDPNGEKMLQAIGVFWGTVFSSAVFVLPRMMQVRADVQRRASSVAPRRNVVVTGLSEKSNVEMMPKALTDGVGVSEAQGVDSSSQRHEGPTHDAVKVENGLEATGENGDNV